MIGPSEGVGLHTLFISGNMCTNNPMNFADHRNNIYGIAARLENRSVTSVRTNLDTVNENYWWSVRLAQHEWSHNYGAEDPGLFGSRCTDTCIMRPEPGRNHNGWFDWPEEVDNVWCPRCIGTILDNINLH